MIFGDSFLLKKVGDDMRPRQVAKIILIHRKANQDNHFTFTRGTTAWVRDGHVVGINEPRILSINELLGVN